MDCETALSLLDDVHAVKTRCTSLCDGENLVLSGETAEGLDAAYQLMVLRELCMVLLKEFEVERELELDQETVSDVVDIKRVELLFQEYEPVKQESTKTEQELSGLVAVVSEEMMKEELVCDQDGNLYVPFRPSGQFVYYYKKDGRTVDSFVSAIKCTTFIARKQQSRHNHSTIVKTLINNPSSSLPRLKTCYSSIAFRNGVYDVVQNVFYPLNNSRMWPSLLHHSKKLHRSWENHGTRLFDVDSWRVPCRRTSCISYHDECFDLCESIRRSRFCANPERICSVLDMVGRIDMSLSELPGEDKEKIFSFFKEMGVDSVSVDSLTTPRQLASSLFFDIEAFGSEDPLLACPALEMTKSTIQNIYSLIGRTLFTKKGDKLYDDYQIAPLFTGAKSFQRLMTSLITSIHGCGAIYHVDVTSNSSTEFPYEGISVDHRVVLYDDIPVGDKTNLSVLQSMVSAEGVRLSQKGTNPIYFPIFDKALVLTATGVPAWSDSHGALMRRLINIYCAGGKGIPSVRDFRISKLVVAASYAYVADLTCSQGGNWMQQCSSAQVRGPYYAILANSIQPVFGFILSHSMYVKDDESIVELDQFRRDFNAWRRTSGLPDVRWQASLYEPAFERLNITILLRDSKDMLHGLRILGE